MKKLTYIVLVLSVFFKVHAQKEAAIWYFGENAGLDFNSGAPVALLDGQIRTQEGCSVISDFNGNLLFYTDGVTVWDRTHTPMPNGTGLNGHPSSTQSGIIVPSPGNPDIYYVFTVDELADTEGLQYSIVDLTLNGGLGDITTKNVLLETPVLEKLTAVVHANGTDIWVVAHRDQGNEFIAYLVTNAGVSATPVVSAIGFDATEMAHVGGYLKFSPDGRFLASAAYEGNYLQLFRFDNATGVISDFLEFESFYQAIAGTRIMGNYGLEFSSDSSKLYVQSTIYFRYPDRESRIYQFDLTNYDAAAIEASATLIVNQPLEIGALQLAIDGRIYAAQFEATYLGVIPNPNVAGVGAGYIQNGASLGIRRSRLGLPPFIQTYFIVGLKASNFCLGDATEFSLETSEPVTTILWDFGDGNTSALENPTHVYTAPGTYTVSVTASTASETKTETKDITIYGTPVANTPTDLIGCTSYGSYNLDMPSFDRTVLGTQDPNDFSVAYFLTQADADSNVNALEPIHSFDYGTTPVFIRVSNRSNGQCYDTTQFNIIAREAPNVPAITDWTVCDDDTDGLFTFDLSQKNAEIFNGQDATKFEILYFASQADADTGTNPLPLNYTNTTATEEIFIRFQNSTYTDCFRTGSFMIEVIPGVTANTPDDLSLCDDNNDGQAFFDLSQTEPEIIGTQNPNSLNISYHVSQNDADTGTNALNANAYLSTAYQNTIYVRVENASDISCYDTTSFDLIIYDTPVVPEVTDWQVCDDNNDGFFLLDLPDKENEILNGASGVSVSFYVSQTDAETSQNPITVNYQNTSNPQTIHFRLENTNNSQCYNVGSFQVQVFDTPTASKASDIIICDTDETGRYIFDLSQKDDEVLNGQDPLYYDVSYHGSETDALNNVSPLSKADYQNTNLNETIWARVQHTDLESCFDISSFNLIVNPLPQMNMQERYVICPDSPDLVIDGGVFESYSWRDASDNEIGNQPTLDITALGDYSLTVSQITNGVACEHTAYFEVVSSGAPETFEVDLNGFSDEIELELLANGI
ncbi:PKD domain-containing protein, partial [Maribacter sp. PR1]